MDDIVLTESQQLQIHTRLNDESRPPASIKEILELIFPDRVLDARSKEGMAVRKFIASQGLEYKPARQWIPKKTIVLTEEQKAFITNNINVSTPLEMARTLFDNRELTNTDSETREIYKYIKTLPTNLKSTSIGEEINVENYTPPKTEVQVLARIFKYVSSPNIDKDNLTEKNKRDLKSLIGYLHTMRFLAQINDYGSVKERELFESEFIRCTYDKALTEEEVSQYIMYCTEVIIAKQIDKRVQDLEAEQDRQIQESGRPNMALVQQISALRGEYHQCLTRQKASLKSLQGERKERLKNESTYKLTMADLIVYVQSEEKRKHLVEMSRARREKLKEEINRIKTMDQIKAEIFGISEEEIID